MYVTIFVTDWEQKTSLTKLVLKRSVLRQSLPNFQHKLLLRCWYESYIEAAQNFIMYVTIFVTDWGQKISY
jgi:dephospho-CoA kinase